jgi:hypothetical protein
MFRLVGAYSTVGCIKAMEDFRCVELPNSARIKNGDNFRQDSFRPETACCRSRTKSVPEHEQREEDDRLINGL